MSSETGLRGKGTVAILLGAGMMAFGAALTASLGVPAMVGFACGIGLMILGIVDAARFRADARRRKSEGSVR